MNGPNDNCLSGVSIGSTQRLPAQRNDQDDLAYRRREGVRQNGKKWWEEDTHTQKPIPVGTPGGVGSQVFMGGAAWFARTAVHLTEVLASDLNTLMGESLERTKDLDFHSSYHTTAERALLLEQTHKRFLDELRRRVARRVNLTLTKQAEINRTDSPCETHASLSPPKATNTNQRTVRRSTGPPA